MKNIPIFSQTKTLYYPVPGKPILVEAIAGRWKSRRKQFASAALALDWSLSNGAAFAYSPSSASHVLFVPSPGTTGVLVTTDKLGRKRTRTITFQNPQAALAWAMDKRAAMVFFNGVAPQLN